MRIHNNQVYITQSMLARVADPSGKLVRCVYRFNLDDKNAVGDTARKSAMQRFRPLVFSC